MSARTPSQRSQFDNLSYISDGRDRISYNINPYPSDSTRSVSSPSRQRVILQPNELNRSRPQSNPIYAYQSDQDRLHGYNNAAFRYVDGFQNEKRTKLSRTIGMTFSDISGGDSRGPSIRTVYEKRYRSEGSIDVSDSKGKSLSFEHRFLFHFDEKVSRF